MVFSTPLGRTDSLLQPPPRITALRPAASAPEESEGEKLLSRSTPRNHPTTVNIPRLNSTLSAAPTRPTESVPTALGRTDSNSQIRPATQGQPCSRSCSTISLAASEDLVCNYPAGYAPSQPKPKPIPEIYDNPEVFPPRRLRASSTATTILEFPNDQDEKEQSTCSTCVDWFGEELRESYASRYRAEYGEPSQSLGRTTSGHSLMPTHSSSSLQRTDSVVSNASTWSASALAPIREDFDLMIRRDWYVDTSGYESDEVSLEEVVIPAPGV